MSKVQCRNCDEYGHDSRGCPKPRDYSRVQCQNCGEYGHTKVRCKKETVAPDNFDEGNTGDGGFTGFKGAPEPASDGWMKEASANATTANANATTASGDGWGAGGADW
ncbi:hypothetical protein F5B22DRAFT_510547 [Xylaria bambusicola]|uniref:uncharacterized protein n=1 Tax=Xylaria bambusicola TaxID=326684 RepID=UPI0020079267|nr:uncharacterized protein F5B22DRAFT_510547 [Xylaria bambusicola]KAI0521931.1 hypothetical protein F5B22DRAFT_510547 [Xylaria bambusicola]